MGSNRNRKKKDKPLIRRPESITSQEAQNNDAGTNGKKSAADMCPLAFQIAARGSEITLIKGMAITLIRKGESYGFYINGIELGILNKKQSEIISNCGAIGINYSGSIVEDKEKFYARFIRIA